MSSHDNNRYPFTGRGNDRSDRQSDSRQSHNARRSDRSRSRDRQNDRHDRARSRDRGHNRRNDRQDGRNRQRSRDRGRDRRDNRSRSPRRQQHNNRRGGPHQGRTPGSRRDRRAAPRNHDIYIPGRSGDDDRQQPVHQGHERERRTVDVELPRSPEDRRGQHPPTPTAAPGVEAKPHPEVHNRTVQFEVILGRFPDELYDEELSIPVLESAIVARNGRVLDPECATPSAPQRYMVLSEGELGFRDWQLYASTHQMIRVTWNWVKQLELSDPDADLPDTKPYEWRTIYKERMARET